MRVRHSVARAFLWLVVAPVNAQPVNVEPPPASATQSQPVAAEQKPREPVAPGPGTNPAAKTPGSTPAASTPAVTCAALTEAAMDVDLRAATAQAQRTLLGEQLKLLDESVTLWSKTVSACDGRARERAQSNLTASQKAQAGVRDQQRAGPQCEAAHNVAIKVQELARQAMGERRFSEAAALFRRAENMWEEVAERCSGSPRELAERRREQTAVDGHNAEHCAPYFEKALEQTKRFRSSAGTQTREERHVASQEVETVWREAAGRCKGAAQDNARTQAQALARERGTPLAASTPLVPLAAAKPGAASSALGAAAQGAGTAAAISSARIDPRAQSAPSGPQGGARVQDKAAILAPGAPAVPQSATQAASGYAVDGFELDPKTRTWSGTGRIKGSNGEILEGTLVGGKLHGRGQVQFASGESYIGEFQGGTPDGQGVYVWPNGQRYEGLWKRGRPNGEGKLKFANGNQYEGMMVDGEPHGRGRMIFASGESFTGAFNAGAPEGMGVYVWTDGQRYEGPLKRGRPNGEGKLRFANGNHYEGMLVDGEPNGQGRMVISSGGESYVGQFVNGQQDGLGTYSFANGDVYKGQWKEGKKHGSGVYAWKNGDRWEGVYKDDEQTDEGTLVRAN